MEDNAADVELVRQSLKEHSVDLELIVLTDGEKAENWVDDIDSGLMHCPSLVILDLNLPKKSGLEVLKRIRDSGRCGDLPLAIFTSSDATSDRVDAARFGASLYIRKPFNLDEFLRIGGVLKSMLKDLPS